MIVDVRSERVREVAITHSDGESVRISKTGPELANFEVAAVPNGRELSYPGVANVIGNALRELNLEDVEPAARRRPSKSTIAEYRTFDGLRREDHRHRAQRRKLDHAGSERRSCGSHASRPPAADGAAPAAPADPAAEAARINAKVGGWRYKIAGFQYDQMTRRMADLPKPPAAG